MLSTVEVRGEDRCHANPAQATETGLVWQEIRKALAATAWDGTQELARYRTYGYRRRWDAVRANILSEEGSVTEGYAGQPYSSIPLERLLREGFIFEQADGIWYNLPDAGVLQADAFLAEHCFFVVRDSVTKPGQIGLAFEPMSLRGVPDVRGALWLDETTSELRQLDVSFTELPQGVQDDRVGGTVEFLMLPSGAWIVHRWQLRTPTIQSVSGGIREDHRRDQRITITGFNDTGGDVLEITTQDGATLIPPGLARLTGVVYDSNAARPLAGATVAVEGTQFWGRSDATGSFLFGVPLRGANVVTMTKPALDSIGYVSPRVPVQLAPGETTTVSFDIPHASSIARRLCARDGELRDSAIILGLIKEGRSGRPSVGNEIRATWQVLEPMDERLVPRQEEQIARADERGAYALCGLPVGLPITISTNGARPANIVFPVQEEGTLLYARARTPEEPYRMSYRLSHRTFKVDLLQTGAASAAPSDGIHRALSGYVTDASTGLPLQGVAVILNGRDSTLTRDDGTFDLVEVDWRLGDNSVIAHLQGYKEWIEVLGLVGDEDRVELGIRLQQ